MDGGRLGDVSDRLAAAVSRRIVELIDVDAIARQIDVDGIARRLDIDAIATQIDMNALLADVDMDALLARVDVDALLARIDIDALVDRLDVVRLVQRAGIADLVAESTGQVAGSALDVARRQLVGVDTLVGPTFQRLARHNLDTLPIGPGFLATAPAADASLPVKLRLRARAQVTGHYAGPVTRLLAFLADYTVVVFGFTAIAAIGSYAIRVITGLDVVAADRSDPRGLILLAVWAFLYWWGSLAVAGRTLGMGLLGLRAVRADGQPLSSGRAALRVIAMPVSFAVFGLGLLGVLFDRRRRALHDLLAGTAMVYDWGDRPAEIPTPLTSWLQRRGAES